MAALVLLAGAAGAGIVAADLAAAEAGIERRHSRRRLGDSTQVAGGANPLQLAHVVVVERQHQLDRLRLGIQQPQLVEQRLDVHGGQPTGIRGQVDAGGADQAEPLPALLVGLAGPALEPLPYLPASGGAAGAGLERLDQLERQPGGPAGVDQVAHPAMQSTRHPRTVRYALQPRFRAWAPAPAPL